MKRNPVISIGVFSIGAVAAVAALLVSAAAFGRDGGPDSGEEGEYETAFDSVAREVKAGKETFDGEKAAVAARLVAELLPQIHVMHPRLDESLSARAWTNFVNSLDSQHVFFTRSDVEEFEKARLSYAGLVAAGDLSFAKKAFSVLIDRVADRAAFSAAAVSNAVDWAEGGAYKWDRDEEPFPESGEEQDALWRSRVRNALLAARVAWEISPSGMVARAAAAGIEPGPDGTVSDPSLLPPPDPAQPLPGAEKAMDEARDDFAKSVSRYLEILRDADEEFWASRFLDALMSACDPHSNYMSPASSEDFGIDMQLSLQGIGAQLQSDDGAAKVVEIIPGSPAEHDESPERLVRGDKIVAVAQGEDGEFVDIRHWPLYKAVRLIRGPKGTTVRLRVIPASDPGATKIVSLVRDEIKLEEQAASSRVDTLVDSTGSERRIGYVRLPTFYASMKGTGADEGEERHASVDVAKLVAKLNDEAVEGIVLDLRGNGGGSLPDAVYLTGLFLRTGPVVVVRESRRAIALPDNDPAVAFRGPMVVLIDRTSASASEIVAAALQDYGRAIVVGDSHTHGKGTVQTLVPLGGDGALGSLKPTTALFYRVNGRSTQLRGVESDITLPSVLETYPDLGEDKLPNALAWTRIAPARFVPADSGLRQIVPVLQERSEARLATNEAWQARMRLFERFSAFNSNKVVSLDYPERFARACEDNEIIREIERLTGAGGEDDGGEGKDGESGGAGPEAERVGASDAAPAGAAAVGPGLRRKRRGAGAESADKRDESDLVLSEALSILLDIVDLHGSPDGLDASAAPYDFLRSFFQ
ncbi:MAG: carboxy terminal-processing peptidase [Kiritimatiellae bacterium]|nr:carboxy terminal-processing peptidase [Kiritimatiellia bacterium]